MKRHYNILFLALIPLMLFALVGCAADDDNEGNGNTPISFACTDAGIVTRAGESAREPLSSHITDFNVYGINGKVTDGNFVKRTNGTVFPDYRVQFTANTANTTTSNSSDWEYVGINGQNIKYWDQQQDCHYFWAVGQSDKGNFSSPTLMDDAQDGRVKNISISNIINDGKTYYTDPTCVQKIDYGKPVPLLFKSIQARIRVGFYETLEGGTEDKVSAIYFYPANAEGNDFSDEAIDYDSETPTVPFIKGAFIDKINATINYSYTGTKPVANVETTMADGAATTSMHSLVSFSIPEGEFLSSSSLTPTYANNGEYINVLPYNNTEGLTIKCDYLVASNSREPSPVQGKYATIPATYCNWQSNKAYTYIFKITEGGAIVLADVHVDDWSSGVQTIPQEWHNW